MNGMDRPQLPRALNTARLELRPFELDDADDILAYATDQEWGRFLPVPRPYERIHVVEFLARQILLDRTDHPTWAIVHQGAVVGGVNIRFDFANLIGEMGYSIARGLWGNGLTTEAARAILDSAFEVHPDLRRVRAAADARNIGSIRVMEKIGMQREALLRKDRLLRGEPWDVVWCGILREEWVAGSGA